VHDSLGMGFTKTREICRAISNACSLATPPTRVSLDSRLSPSMNSIEAYAVPFERLKSMNSAYILVRNFPARHTLFEISALPGRWRFQVSEFSRPRFRRFQVASFKDYAHSAVPSCDKTFVARRDARRACQPLTHFAIGFGVGPGDFKYVFLFRAAIDRELAEPLAAQIGFLSKPLHTQGGI